MLVEPYIENFMKFNSNSGKAEDVYEVMQALSHFSYHHSEGEMCLQGRKCTTPFLSLML